MQLSFGMREQPNKRPTQSRMGILCVGTLSCALGLRRVCVWGDACERRFACFTKEQLAQRARLPLQDASAEGRLVVAPDLGLTPRELEVLSHLVRGSTDREISEALFISKKTASVHVSNLLRKLDVANRIEAGRVGQAHGVA